MNKKLLLALFSAVLVGLASCSKDPAPGGGGDVLPPEPPKVYYAPANTKFQVVGYIPSYRTLSSIPDSKLKMMDVVCYAFATINTTSLLPVVDKPQNLRDLVTRCKPLGVKVLISFSGPRADYVRMVNNKTTRDKFIAEMIKIVEDYNLDGIDNDWEYPSTVDGGADSNLQMMKEFSTYLHDPSRNKLLTMAITSAIYKGGYTDGIKDDLHKYVDWYNVMIYGWAAGTSEIGKYPTVMSKLEMSYHYWITTRKMPTSKFLIGIGCYGRPSGIEDTGRTLLYSNIVSQGANNHNLNEAIVTSNSFPGQSFTIYYDGQPLVKQKTKFAKDQKLGGMMFWEVGQDIQDDRSLIKATNDQIGRIYN